MAKGSMRAELDDRASRHADSRRRRQRLRRAAHDPRRHRKAAVRHRRGRPRAARRSRGRVLYAVGPSPREARPGRRLGGTDDDRAVRQIPAVSLPRRREGDHRKGELHGEIVRDFRESGAVYLAAIGGLGALLGKRVIAAEVVAFPELGPEALYQFTVRDFPAVVIIDREGRNFHEIARARWRRTHLEPQRRGRARARRRRTGSSWSRSARPGTSRVSRNFRSTSYSAGEPEPAVELKAGVRRLP